MKLSPSVLLPILFIALADSSLAQAGSIHNHLTLDLLPLVMSANNPAGTGLALSYDRYHDWLKSSYEISIEETTPFSFENHRMDVNFQLGFFTEINPAFSIGARVGVVVNNPGQPAGFGALGLRLPALHPEEKEFFSFFFEEIDLGLSGAGERYAGIRLGMKLL
ncbi:hypothetical protein WDW37_02225 [Bdellovibrionota bacterium FG-1]